MANCANFINRPANSYIPLSCKPIIVTTRFITSGGDRNKQEYFLLAKANTIRESATVDLLYTHPQWLRREIESKLPRLADSRITEGGDIRLIDSGLIRVIH